MDADPDQVGASGRVSFRSTLDRFTGVGAPHYFAVPTDVAQAMGGKQGARLKVSVDAKYSDHLALRRRGEVFFVSAGEKMRRRCRLVVGTSALLSVEPDPSPHGIPVPKVLREVLRYDTEAGGAFAKLTPGARRTYITRVRKGRTRESRIHLAMAIADELCGRPRGSSQPAHLPKNRYLLG